MGNFKILSKRREFWIKRSLKFSWKVWGASYRVNKFIRILLLKISWISKLMKWNSYDNKIAISWNSSIPRGMPVPIWAAMVVRDRHKYKVINIVRLVLAVILVSHVLWSILQNLAFPEINFRNKIYFLINLRIYL